MDKWRLLREDKLARHESLHSLMEKGSAAMTQVIDSRDLCRRQLVALVGTFRAWKYDLADALATRAPMTDDERVEYLTGFLDPETSWQAMMVEQVQAFPGAMARADDILGKLIETLQQLLINDLLLCSVEEVLDRVGRIVASVRREAAEYPALGMAVADFDEALADLDRLGLAWRRAVEERRASL